MEQAKQETCPHCGQKVALDDRRGRRGMLRPHLAAPLTVGCKGSGGYSIELQNRLMAGGGC